MVSILNLGAGKLVPMNLDSYEPYFLVNVDRSYYSKLSPDQIEEAHNDWLCSPVESYSSYLSEEMFTFMEYYIHKFNLITLYRVLEHIPRDKALYFIYLMADIMEKNGRVQIIVPDYKKLAQRILDEDPYSYNFEKEDIITSTELFNERHDPHQLITTPDRVKRMFELEGRFEMEDLIEDFEFEGRNIYFYSSFKRV